MFLDKEEKVTQKPGKSWKSIVYRSTYAEADKFRNEKLKEKDLDVKVKFMPSMDKFAVKTRKKAIVESETELVKDNKEG